MKPKTYGELLNLISVGGIERKPTQCRYCGVEVNESRDVAGYAACPECVERFERQRHILLENFVEAWREKVKR